MSQDKVGCKCHWVSQAAGSTKEKRGVILAFVPARRSPISCHPGLEEIPESFVKSPKSLLSRSDRYLVRIDRIGKKGQALEPRYYLPRRNAVQVEVEETANG